MVLFGSSTTHLSEFFEMLILQGTGVDFFDNFSDVEHCYEFKDLLGNNFQHAIEPFEYSQTNSRCHVQIPVCFGRIVHQMC